MGLREQMVQRVELAALYFIAVRDVLNIHASSRRKERAKLLQERKQTGHTWSIHSDPGSPISGLFKSSW